MDQHVRAGGLDIAPVLHRFVEEEALPGSGLDPAAFWDGFGELVRELAPRNRELLARRDELQRQLDGWHHDHPGRPDQEAYAAHLREIGYLLDEPGDVAVTTSDVDDEVARIAGPQLVVPLLNARFATNAVNARWGSLYDALYGSDLVPREGDLAPGEAILLYRFSGRALFDREIRELARHRGLQVVFLPGHRRAAGSWLGSGIGSVDDQTALTSWVPDIADRDVYVCGPQPWAEDVRRSTAAAGLPASRFHVECFGW